MLLDSLFIIFAVLLVYALPAAPLTAITALLGRWWNVRWRVCEYLFVVFPGVTWILISLNVPQSKTPNNWVEELFLSGVCGGLILVPRLFIDPPRLWKKILITAISTVVACGVAATIYFVTPSRPL
jgi:hypothetical protein